MTERRHRRAPTARSLPRRATSLAVQLHRGLCLLLVAALALAPATAFADDITPTVVKGRVSISETDGQWVVDQFSKKAKIQWNEFPDEVVFNQARGKRSKMHNDVHSEFGTYFDGSLSANGIVYLTDALGVTIGANARIDAARFVAAGGLLAWDDFESGRDHFTQITGHVENQGRIEADSVALLGKSVTNSGQILSRESVIMLAGNEAWIGEHNSPVVVHLQLPDGDDAAQAASTGSADRSGASSLGAGDPLGFAIVHTGTTRAKEIFVDSGETGITKVAGTLDASSVEHGGDITILGDIVGVVDAVVDASGSQGGGRVRVGGDERGQGTVRNAQLTYVDAESEIRADALDSGDGGDVVVWSDGNTIVRGAISARGGARGGNGGFAEVSGAKYLEVPVFPDVTAPKGRGGSLLLDPNNITIVANAQDEISDPRQDLDRAFEDDLARLRDPEAIILPETDDSYISAPEIENALRQGVSIRLATDSTNEEEATDIGDIVVDAPIQIFAGDAVGPKTEAELILSAANDITVNQPITNESENLTLDILITANDFDREEKESDTSGGQDHNIYRGDLVVNQPIASGGGAIELSGWNVTLAESVTSAPASGEGGGGRVLVNQFLDEFGVLQREGSGGDVSIDGDITTDGGDLVVFTGTVFKQLNEGTGEEVITKPVVQISSTLDATSVNDELGGSLILRFAGATVDLEAGSSLRTGGNLVDVSSSTQVFDDTSEADIDVLRQGTLNLESEVVTDGGFAILSATELKLASTSRVETNGGSVFLDTGGDDASITDLGGTIALQLDGRIESQGGDIFIGGGGASVADLDGAHDVTFGNGAILDARVIPSDPDAASGNIALTATGVVTSKDAVGVQIRGGTIELAAATDGTGDLDNPNDTAHLNLTGSGLEIEADAISLEAGNGYDFPDAEDPHVDSQVLLAGDARFYKLDDPSLAPDSFEIHQDAPLGDDQIPDPARFGGPIDGMGYVLESTDGNVTITSPAKVARSKLTLSAKNSFDLPGGATPLDLESISLVTQEELRLSQDLADRIAGGHIITLVAGRSAQSEIAGDDGRTEVKGDLIVEENVSLATDGLVESSLTLAAGDNGWGNLIFERADGSAATVALGAETIRLGAGNGTTFEGDAPTDEIADLRKSFIELHDGVMFDGAQTFEFSQDADVTDALLPGTAQFTGAVPPASYRIRSADGSITIETPDKIADTHFEAAALNGIAFDSPVTLRTADLRGIQSWEVPVALLDNLQVTGEGGTGTKIVLGAGASAADEQSILSFEVIDEEVDGETQKRGGMLSADEIQLVSGPESPLVTGNAAISNITFNDELKLTNAAGDAAPDLLVIRTADGLKVDPGSSTLPSVENFSTDDKTIGLLALRVDSNQGISLERYELLTNSPDDPDRAGLGLEYDDILVSAAQLSLGDSILEDFDREGTIEDIAAQGRVRTNLLLADGFNEKEPGTTQIDFSGMTELQGFDSGLQDDGTLTDFDPYDTYVPGGDFNRASPVTLAIQQDGRFEGAQLPPSSLADTDVVIRTYNADIDLSTETLASVLTDAGRLRLEVAAEAPNDANPAFGDKPIAFPAQLSVKRLEVDVEGALQVQGDAAVHLIAEEKILLQAGATGQLEDGSAANLSFSDPSQGGGVTLEANEIQLTAGDGFNIQDYPNPDDPDSPANPPADLPSVVVTNATFVFTEPIPEAGETAPAPSFKLTQDASLVLGNLPDLRSGTQRLGSYQASSLEGEVIENEDTGGYDSFGTIEIDGYTTQANANYFNSDELFLNAARVRLSEPGDLDFAGANAPKVIISGGRVDLESTSGSIAAATEQLELRGEAFGPDDTGRAPDPDSAEGLSPDFVFLRQSGDISGANAPLRQMYSGDTEGVNLGLVSTGGQVLIDEQIGISAPNSDLLAVAELGRVRIEADPGVSTLTVLSKQGIDIETASITTSGNSFATQREMDQRYLGPVNLLGTSHEFSGVGVEFADTVSGAAADLLVDGLDVAFRSDVSVASLTVNTFGGSSPFDEQPYTLAFGGLASSTDYGGLDFYDDGILSEGAPTDLLPASADMGALAVGVTADRHIALNLGELDGGVPATPDNLPILLVPAPGVREEIPDVATITQSSGSLDLTSLTGDVWIGPLEKVTVGDTLRIIADGAGATARFADLTALDMEIRATNLLIDRRTGGDVQGLSTYDEDGELVKLGTVYDDNGVDLVANTISLEGDVQPVGEGRDPVFGIQDPRDLGSVTTLTRGLPLVVAGAKPDLTPLTLADLFDGGGHGLDGVPLGPSRADLSGAIPDLAQALPRVHVPLRPALVNQDLVERMGVHPRAVRPAEWRRALSGAGIYDDVGESHRLYGGLNVVEARLRPGEAQRAVVLYDEIFGADRARVPEIRTVLQNVVDDYRAATGARRVVGFELRRFVRNRPSSQFDAYVLLERLDALFRHHRRLGLAAGEYRRAQREWLEDIAPSGITLDELAETIHPSRYVRGSDILDIF